LGSKVTCQPPVSCRSGLGEVKFGRLTVGTGPAAERKTTIQLCAGPKHSGTVACPIRNNREE
jgi:hypothetical protein